MSADTSPRSARWARFIPVLLLALGLAWTLACGGSIETRLAEVRALHAAGQFSESIEPLREVLAMSPDLPEANHLLGVALVQTGQPSLAVWSLEKAARSPEYGVPSGLLLASTFLSLENFEESVRAADRVLELAPDRGAALQIRAHANLGAGRREESLADTRRLLETDPDGYQANVFYAVLLAELDEIEQSEKAHQRVRELGDQSEDPSLAAKGCLALANFYEDNMKAPDRAETIYLECLDAHPGNALAVRLSTQFFDASGRFAKGTEILQRAVEHAPESLSLRTDLANRLFASGQQAAGEELLVETAETFGTAQAWAALAQYRRSSDDEPGALEALERALEVTGGKGDRLRFRYADLLVELGELERADEILETLEQPAYQDLIRGRILLARGEPRQALAAFEEGIRRWPNNAGARQLAGVAALQLGEFDAAIAQLREAVRVDKKATDAALNLGGLFVERGQPAQALSFLSSYLENRNRRRPEALLLVATAASQLGKYDDARKSLEALRGVEGNTSRWAVARAALETQAEGAPAGVRFVLDSGVDTADPAQEATLRWLADALARQGRANEALRRVDAALSRSPDTAALYELRGVVLAQAGQFPQAEQAFRRALQIDDGYALALNGLATLALRSGDTAAARQLAQRAVEADATNVGAAYLAAQLAFAAGDAVDAERRLRGVVGLSAGHAGARNDLAWLLAERGEELDLALQLADQARRSDGRPEMLDTLGWVYIQRGEYAEAAEVLEQAAQGLPESGSIRYRLGLALAKQGERERARSTLRQALDAAPFPEAQAARRELAQLEQP